MKVERAMSAVVPRRAWRIVQLVVVAAILGGGALAADAVVPLEVHADGSVLLDGRFIRYFHRLDVNLDQLAAQQPKPIIEITATQNVTDEVMGKVKAALAKAGLESRVKP